MYDYPGRNAVTRALQRMRRSAPILWETHEEGERLLREELEPLRADGYEMVHDRLLDPGGRQTVDTILVGPAGVFVFDAKHWWGKVTVERNRLIQEKRHRWDRTGEIDKLLTATKRVGQVASSYVHPYVVLTGEAQVAGSPFVGKVRIRGLSGTADMVRGQIQTVPPHDVHRITSLIDAEFPPRQGRGSSDDVPEGAAVLPSRPRPAGAGAGMVAPSLLSHLRGSSAKAAKPVEGRTRAFSGIFPGRSSDTGAATGGSGGQESGSAEPSGKKRREEPPHAWSEPARNTGPWARRSSRGRADARSTAEAGAWSAEETGRRWRLPHIPLMPLLVVLGLLVGLILIINAAPGLLGRAMPCSAVSENFVEQVTDREVEGRRRLTGDGCVFDSTDSGEEVVLVLTGGDAERRAPGTSGITVSPREDCGVLVVAPARARLPGLNESTARRATAAAACVRPPSGRNATRRAERMAVRIIAAVRREAAQG